MDQSRSDLLRRAKLSPVRAFRRLPSSAEQKNSFTTVGASAKNTEHGTCAERVVTIGVNGGHGTEPYLATNLAALSQTVNRSTTTQIQLQTLACLRVQRFTEHIIGRLEAHLGV
jgi:hypothetical protein